MSGNGLFNAGENVLPSGHDCEAAPPCFLGLQEQTRICEMIRFVDIGRQELMQVDGGGLGSNSS